MPQIRAGAPGCYSRLCVQERLHEDAVPVTSYNKTASPRRRRALTVTYLLFIYATLGIVRPIAEQLRAAGLLRSSVTLLFMVCSLLALTWRYTATDRIRLGLRVVLISSLLAIALFMPGLPEERLHFLTYGLLGWMICWSVEAGESNSLWATGRWLLPCLLVWLAGGIDELIQWWLPGRVFDLRDILFNGGAGTLGIGLFATGSRKSVPSPCPLERKSS